MYNAVWGQSYTDTDTLLKLTQQAPSEVKGQSFWSAVIFCQENVFADFIFKFK